MPPFQGCACCARKQLNYVSHIEPASWLRTNRRNHPVARFLCVTSQPLRWCGNGGVVGLPATGEAVQPLMASGSFIDRTNPTFVDLRRREVIKVRCRCGREVQIPPERLIGLKGITQYTKVWSLRYRFSVSLSPRTVKARRLKIWLMPGRAASDCHCPPIECEMSVCGGLINLPGR